MPTQGIIPLILPVHILAGALALAFGYVALSAAKGGLLHRRSGQLFVIAMAAMALSGAAVAVLNGSIVSVVAGLLTFYLVTTALLTVRPRNQMSGRLDAAAVILALCVAVFGFKSGFDLLGTRRPETIPVFMFGAVGLLSAAGDIRVMRAHGIQGGRRIARHLWRMCFAMWIAAASFFWGPPGRVPEVIRIPALLPVPVLLPVAVMLYWLWRIRVRPRLPGVAVRDSNAVALAAHGSADRQAL